MKLKKIIAIGLCLTFTSSNFVFASEWEDQVKELDKSKKVESGQVGVLLEENLSNEQKEQRKKILEDKNDSNIQINRTSSNPYSDIRQISVVDEEGYSHIIAVNASCTSFDCEKYKIISSDKKSTITEITPKMQENIENQLAMSSNDGNIAKKAIMYSSITAITTSDASKATKAIMFLMALSQANQAKSQADSYARAVDEANAKKEDLEAKKEALDKRVQNYQNKTVVDSQNIKAKVFLNPQYPMISDFIENAQGEVVYDENNNPLTKPIYAKIKVSTNEKIKSIIVNLPEMNQKVSVADNEEFMVEKNRTLGEKTFSYEITTETGKVEKGSLSYKVSQYANALTDDKKAVNFTSTYIVGNKEALTANEQKVDIAGQLGSSSYDNNVCRFSVSSDNQSVIVENSAISKEGCEAQNSRSGEYITVENGNIKLDEKGDAIIYSDTDEMKLKPITREIYNEMVDSANKIINETQADVDVIAYDKETKELKKQVLGMEGKQYVNVYGLSVPINLNTMAIEYPNGKSISSTLEKQLNEKGINTSALRLGVDPNGIGYIWDDSAPDKKCVSCMKIQDQILKKSDLEANISVLAANANTIPSINGYSK